MFEKKKFFKTDNERLYKIKFIFPFQVKIHRKTQLECRSYRNFFQNSIHYSTRCLHKSEVKVVINEYTNLHRLLN